MKSKIASPIRLTGSGHENQKNKLQNWSKNLKKTIFILAIAFIAVLTSCSKDDASSPVVEPTPVASSYRIKEIRNASNLVNQAFEYNAQNQVTKITNANNSTITNFYNSLGLLSKSVIAGNADNSLNTITNYTYDSNKLLSEEFTTYSSLLAKSKIVYTNSATRRLTATRSDFQVAVVNDWVLQSITRFTYNDMNQIIVSQTDDSPGGYLGRKNTFFYDTSGNLLENKEYDKATAVGPFKLYTSITRTYDKIKPTNYINSTLFKNNVLDAVGKVYDATGTNVVSQSSSAWSYDYTTEGNISKVYLDNALYSINILEKIN